MVRLYNWNLLAPVFQPFGITLDQTTRTLVVAGDLDAVANVLEKFYERTVGELPPIMPKVVAAMTAKRSNTPDVFNGVIDNGGSMLDDPAPITSRITAATKNVSVSRPGLRVTDPAGRSLIDMNDDPLWTNSPTKMPGEKGPPEKPLRGADDEDDPFGFLQDPDSPKTPLELLGRSIEASFGLGKGEGEVLLSSQPGTFMEWMKGQAKPPRVKGPNAAATHWLDGIRSHSKTLALLMTGPPEKPEEPSEGYVASVFDAVGAGLYNKNAGVVSSAIKALKSVARHLPRESPVLRYAHNWLASTGGPSVAVVKILCGLGGDKIGGNIRVGDAKAAADAARAAAVDAGNGFETSRDDLDQRGGAQFALGYNASDASGDGDWSRRAAEASAMAEMIDRFCAQESRHLHKFLLDDLRAAANARDNPKIYMDALNVLMPAMLARGAKPREAMVKEGTPGSMLLSALQCAEGPEDLREVSLTLLTTLWSAFPDEIEIKGEECRQVINCLKKAARAPDPGTQIHSLACMFQLLHSFITASNAFSPVVYKTIVFMLIEHMRNDPVRDFISAELKLALDNHANIPVGILVDPVVKQCSPGGQHPGLKRVDFQLMAAMAEHARLEARPALHLLQLCLQTAMDHVKGQDPAEERAIALKAATRLAARLRGEDAAEEVIERCAGGALARIAASAEDATGDPAFGEMQRCAGEALMTCARCMAQVGGSGVGALKSMIANSATTFASHNGTTHPDIEASLDVLRMAGDIGSGSDIDSPSLHSTLNARRTLPPGSPSGMAYDRPPARGRPPVEQLVDYDPPGVGGGAFSPPPAPLAELDAESPSDFIDPPRPPARKQSSFEVKPKSMVKSSGYGAVRKVDPRSDVTRKQRDSDGSVRSPSVERPRPAGVPKPPVRSPNAFMRPTNASLHQRSGVIPAMSEMSLDDEFSSPPAHESRFSRPPGPSFGKPRFAQASSVSGRSTSSAALALQREKREAEIRQIALKREMRLEKEAIAKEREQLEKEKRDAGLRRRRQEWAKKAELSGRGSNFLNLSDRNRDQSGLAPKQSTGVNDRMIRTGPPPEALAAMLSPEEQEAKVAELNGLLAEDSHVDLPLGYKKVKNADGSLRAELTDEAKAAAKLELSLEKVRAKASLSPRRVHGIYPPKELVASPPKRRDVTPRKPRDPNEKTFLQKKKEEEKARKEAEEREARARAKSKMEKQKAHAEALKAELEQKKKAKEAADASAAAELRAKKEKKAAALKAKEAAAATEKAATKAKIEAFEKKRKAEKEERERLEKERKKKELEDARAQQEKERLETKAKKEMIAAEKAKREAERKAKVRAEREAARKKAKGPEPEPEPEPEPPAAPEPPAKGKKGKK